VKNNKLRREINRRQFLKRRIAQLLTDGSDPIKLAEFQKELAESLKNRKRVPLSEMPNGAPQSTVDASAAPATPIDPAVMAKGLALAQSYLRSLENNQESNAE
jgi:hypothetical protein